MLLYAHKSKLPEGQNINYPLMEEKSVDKHMFENYNVCKVKRVRQRITEME